MKMKWYKVVVGTLVIFLGLVFLLALWYKNMYSMNEAETFMVNAPELEKKLLIATQGSDFKNSVTQGIVNRYKSDSVFIRVMDISLLPEIDLANFDAVLLMHTWEYGKPPEIISTFMESADPFKAKMVVLTTSGNGDEKMEGIDAITGESILDEVPIVEDKIIARLDLLLYSEN